MGKILFLFLAVFLASCGGGGKTDGSAGSTSTGVGTSPTITREAEASCAQMPGVEPFSKTGNQVSPESFKIWISEANGAVIKNIWSANYASAAQFDPPTFFSSKVEYDNLRDAMAVYPTKYVTVECGYLATRLVSSPFYLRGIYKISDIGKSELVVSFASDLLARALMRGGEAQYSSIVKKITNTFGADAFILPIEQLSWDRRYDTFDEKSRFMAIQEAILSSAKDYSATSVTVFTDYVAAHMLGNCIDASLCALYGSGQGTLRTLNSGFSSGLSNWKSEVNVNPDRVYRFSAGIDGVAFAELGENKSSANGFGSIMIFQENSLNINNLQKHIFNFEILGVSGGTTAFIANASASGVAGVFFCFDSSSVTLGCYAAGAHTDIIRLSINVGNMFNIGNTESLAYDEITSQRAIRLFSVGKLAERIPTVRTQMDKITSVRYGIFAKEQSIDGAQRCPRCFSSVSADSIGLSVIN